MSWWTDIRDTFTAPATSIWNVATSPFVALTDVIEGKNVGDTIKSTVSRDFASAIKIANPGFGLATTGEGSKILNNKTVSALSLGYSSDFAGTGTALNKTEDGQSLDKHDILSVERYGVKSAIAAAAIGVAGAGAAGNSAGTITGYSAAQAAAHGNYFGAAGTLAGGFIPGELGDVSSGFLDSIGSKPAAPTRPGAPGAPVVSGYLPDGSFSAPDTQPSVLLPVMLVAGVAALIYLRKRRHA